MQNARVYRGSNKLEISNALLQHVAGSGFLYDIRVNVARHCYFAKKFE